MPAGTMHVDEVGIDPYYRETNPVLAANARHVIHEVLGDHQRRLTDVA